MYIRMVQSSWTQEAGSCLSEAAPRYYKLFYFPTSVQIRVGDELICTEPNACIFSTPKHPRWLYFPETTTMCWMHNHVQIGPLLEKYQIPLNQVFYPNNPGFISELFRKLRKEFRSNNPHKEELLDGYTQELLIKLSRSIKYSTTVQSVSSHEQKLIQDLHREILSYPERKWTVADMAKKVHLSPSRFHAVYRQMFHSTPVSDVINAKIDQAKAALLLDDNTDIATIAEKMGYNNQYHFIRQFKTATGVTPGAYRRNNR